MGKKSGNHKQFLKFDNIEKAKIRRVKLNDEVLEVLGMGKHNKTKSYRDFMIEDIGESEHAIFISNFNNYIHQTIPASVKATCKFCEIEGDEHDGNKACTAYYSEGHINLFFALGEFYKIRFENKHLFTDKEQIKRLCYSFIACFMFHKGRVYFDVKQLGLQCLKEGLLSISQILTNTEPFGRLKLINESLHKLDNEQRYYTIDNGEKNELIEFQINHFKEAERYYEKKYSGFGVKKEYELESVWLAEAKLSIKDLLQLGIDKSLWNENYEIITKKGSLYGTGKTLLSNLAHALRGYSISEETDYKVIGKAFCEKFNIAINQSTKEPYKSFNKEIKPIKNQLKRAFSIR